MRLLISKKAYQALQALLLLGDQDGRVTATDLAAHLDLSAGLLHQVVRPLVTARWVESATGPSGGYRLVRPLAEIDLLAVIEAVEGPTDDGRCVLTEDTCSNRRPTCLVHEAWLRARDSLTHELRTTPLQTLGPVDAPSLPGSEERNHR